MAHQKDFQPAPTGGQNLQNAGSNPEAERSDNPGQAPESGEPQMAGRSRGQVIGENDPKQTDDQPEHPESGRHRAAPKM